MGRNSLMYQEDVDSICLDIHDWFVRHPLGTTEEGYDHFREYFEALVSRFSTGDYRNYN
jgi:hypothetical protein